MANSEFSEHQRRQASRARKAERDAAKAAEKQSA
jgi:hypothetical protein